MPKKPIDHYEHPDTLPNNPTQELSGFAEEEYAPTRYPRDTALDPQLVWKGKDQQNDSDLEVHTVPIYRQEHIQPQAIIENLRAQQQRESNQTEMLFEGFNDLDFNEKIEFYQHEQNWHNRFILGDSLAVMNSLAEKEDLKRSVQMIYIDPPYGVKFKSNWQVSTQKREVEDVEEDVTPQPEQVKAYRDTWNFGIHSYLAYLRDRLTAAHGLLTDSGSVFIQISEKNVHQVRCLLDEVFDDTNFVATITVARGNTTSSTGFPLVADYLLWYAKSKDELKYRQLYMKRDERTPDPLLKSYTQVELADGTRRGMTRQEIENPALLPQGSRRFANYHLTSQSSGNEVPPAYKFEGKVFTTTGGRSWSASLNGLERLDKQGRLRGPGKVLYYIKYASDLPGRAIANVWTDTVGSSGKIYAVQTNTKVVQRCMLMTTDPGDLVLDPTCGSGTTAYVAEQLGRRWITVDTSRVSLALARTRLMTAKYPYYRLVDVNDIKQGFTYKTAPDISLSDMANNTEIDDIHTEYAEKLDPLLEILNTNYGGG
ncbi:MAG: site-specific DNA-methyltransferase [Candidatus Poribacteria bacterium]|nr:site-specific DNA-methyltransferase [Candidatus Poribacteria bacterium]